MALTITVTSHNVIDNKRTAEGTVTFDSSYPTGGEDLSPASFSMKQIDSVEVLVTNVAGAAFLSSGGQLVLGGTASAPKLLLYAAGVQAANGSDQSAVARGIRVRGS